MLERVLDALLARLESQHAAILGRTRDGLELRVERSDSAAPRRGSSCVSISVQVPEVPQGVVHVVLCRWSDLPGVLVYPSLDGGAPRPQWTHLELVPPGVRLVVKWEHEDEARDYAFQWLRKSLAPA